MGQLCTPTSPYYSLPSLVHYRLVSTAHRQYRIGYAAQGQDSSFDVEVQIGLKLAAEREGVELIVLHQLNQMRKLHRQKAIGAKQHAHPFDEVV